ncbi:MAG: CHAT domain-containing protein, partial [Rhodospirillales bacterium]|nr:CHAT domain-containing protein [Rhodospirillales bacterium]
MAEAERLGCPLELALHVEDALAGLPWETLRLSAHALPLTLHPRVHLYRRLPSQGAATAIAISPPLRILVAIASPEAQNPRGQLLDMEAELRRILDATEKAKGKAHVRILETGSPEAIREALRQQRYHVLYISCHAEPGKLVLETADGAEVKVSAAKLTRAIPAGRAAPLVVLAACSTASDRPGDTEAKAEELPGIARALVAKGVPQVIAMQGPVSDTYATLLAGELLEALAGWEQPEVLTALASARRDLERSRLQTPATARQPPEWATPALYASAEPLPLFDPKAKPETIESRPEPRLDPGVLVRRVGEMVGRRRELRLARRTLGDPQRAGVVVHGMGGVGKSTLAAELMHRLGADGFVLASLAGSIEVDTLLSEVGRRLLAYARAKELDERHPLREVARLVREPKEPWRDRLGALMSEVLGAVPPALLLDNFEDNLTDGTIGDEALAQLLALWAASPGRSRLIFTCRYPFVLPDEAEVSLEFVHLGPLSFAETRKLILRLPGLNALPAADQRRVYEDVGGHPRALEYLDALLRGGRARFPDVQKRLNAALAKQGVTDPSRWCADTACGLDAALAETVTLASADVLLDDLLARLADQPLAKRLLLGASVYRLPVDETGLAWTVATPIEPPADPERQARIERVHRAWAEAQERGEQLHLPPAEAGQLARDMQEHRRPPIAVPQPFAEACRLLADVTLLSPVRYAEDQPERFLVHRWTAGEVQNRA